MTNLDLIAPPLKNYIEKLGHTRRRFRPFPRKEIVLRFKDPTRWLFGSQSFQHDYVTAYMPPIDRTQSAPRAR